MIIIKLLKKKIYNIKNYIYYTLTPTILISFEFSHDLQL
jgi:hypothetical protein